MVLASEDSHAISKFEIDNMLINESFHKLMGYQGIDPFPDL
jgi:hypothetical protein